MAEEFVSAMEGTRLGGEGCHQSMALVGDTGSALAGRVIGILNCGGRAGDKGVLAVIDGVSVGVRQAQISAASHAAVDGDGCPVVDAGGSALEFVDGAELGDGASQRIDTGREGAGQGTGELPGSEGIDSVKSALKNGAGGIEDGIGESDRRRKIDVEGADQVFAVNVEVRDGDGGVVGDFALDREAGLLHARGHEVAGESGDVVGDALSESGGQTAGGGCNSAGYQRIGIGGEDLVVIEVRVVEEQV